MIKITGGIINNIANYLFNNMGLDSETKTNYLINQLGKQEWDKYTRDELKEIGFRMWDEESDLLLSTPLLLKLTNEGFELDSISCGKTEFNKELDLYDTRLGVTAYGIILK